jgi:hypothetical protein
MSVYWIIVILVIALGLLLPQDGKKKIYYIVIMAIIHAFVCGFKYMYLTGDLKKYAWNYYQYQTMSWLDPSIVNGGKNIGWSYLMKFFSTVSGGNFQVLLIFLAVFIEVVVAILIYRYSSKPWMSYLVWNCMSFYVTYGFNAIKQGMAMAVIMLAMIAIMENKPIKFVIIVCIAGLIHFPAFAFLPAYWIVKRKISISSIFVYIFTTIVIFVFRNPIIKFVTSLYYDDEQFTFASSDVGGRFWVMVLILGTSVVFKGFQNSKFEKIFNLMVVATIFQMFANYSNIFTRFSDYYFQFLIILLPLIFSFDEDDYIFNNDRMTAIIPLSKSGCMLVSVVLVLILLWWYSRTCLGTTVSYETDNYLNYRFMWDVVS